MHTQYMQTAHTVKAAASGWLRKSRAKRFAELGEMRGNTVTCAVCYYQWQGACMAIDEQANECNAILGATKHV